MAGPCGYASSPGDLLAGRFPRLTIDANVIVVGGANLAAQLYGAAEYAAARGRTGKGDLARYAGNRVLARDDAGAALLACSEAVGSKCYTAPEVLREAVQLYRNQGPIPIVIAPGRPPKQEQVRAALESIVKGLGPRSLGKLARIGEDRVYRALELLLPVVETRWAPPDIAAAVKRGDEAAAAVLAAANAALGVPRLPRRGEPAPPA